MARTSMLVSLVVAGGLLATAAHRSPSPAATSAETEMAAGARRARSPAELVPEAQGAAAATDLLHDQLCSALGGPGIPCALDSVPPRLETAIAIFPDPIHTHLALRFDRNVDALIAAAQDAGWFLDRQWLPWTWMVAGAQSSEGAVDKDLADLIKVRTYRRGFESVPGFILFRSSRSGDTAPLVVFIVGDSPISGILPGQFRTAYSMSRRLQAPSAAGKQLRIIGPSFTGSISSLAQLLASPDAPGTDTPFTATRIISPTVSRDLSEVHFDGREFARVSPEPSFKSFAVAQNCRIRAVVDFVKRQTSLDQETDRDEHDLGQGTRIALLSEDESAFGRVANPPRIPGSSGQSRRGPCDLSETSLLHLTFPRDISHLRSAYQKKAVWGFGDAPSGGTSLGLDYADPHEELDAIQNFSGGQNAGSLETTVRQIAETLTDRDIRVVLLNATDVYDELFLARILGRLAPNLSVVVLDSDALFLHQGGGDDYSHVFAASPFPSLPYNLFWTAPSGRLRDQQCTPRIFASESTEGAYLAAGTILVDGPDNRGLPFARRQFCSAEYTSPFSPGTERPPLWMMSITHGGMWPLATLSLHDEAPANLPAIRWPRSEGYEHVTGLERHHIPITLWLGLLALLVLAGCHTWGSTAVTVSSHVLWNYAITDEESRRVRLVLELGLTLIVIAAIRFLIPPELSLLVEHSQVFLFTGYAAIAVLVALTALQAYCLAGTDSPVAVLGRLENRGKSTAPSRNTAGLRVATVSLAAVAAAFAAAWLPWHLITRTGRDHVEFFERYRALYISSGVAPSLPILLLLAALALALLSRLGRLYFVGPWRPVLPQQPPAELRLPSEFSVEPIGELLGHYRPAIRAQSSAAGPEPGLAPVRGFPALLLGCLRGGTPSLWLLVLLTVLLVHVALSWAAPTTLDGGIYTMLLKALAGAVMGSLIFDLLRAWRLWRLLRSLVLRPLERTPLRRGFDRIKGMSWHRVWRTMDSSALFSYHPVRRALELATSAPARLGLDATSSRILHDSWSGLVDAKSDVRLAGDWGHLLHRLTGAAESLLPAMTRAWSEETGGVTGKDDVVAERNKDLERSPESPGDPLPAQEEFVALIYLQYVRIVLIQIRHSLFTAAASYVLVAAALTQYPIVGRHAIEIGLLLLFGMLALTAITVYAAINRDSILSRTTESEPGKLDFDFYVKIASYLGLPLLGLLASQFPELAGTVFSYLQPLAGK